MNAVWDYLHEFHVVSVLIRLILAMLAGAIVGYGRTRRKRPAGLRTYMLTAVGACLAVLLELYEYLMLTGQWADIVEIVGMKYDATRYMAQVVTGIGFLGAGTIIAAAHQQVSGLSTATGLFAIACIGMASGAGFVECVIIVILLLLFVLEFMYPLESAFKRRVRNITVYVQFDSIENLSVITDLIRQKQAAVFDLDIENTKRKEADDIWPSAVSALQRGKGHASHSEMISSIAELGCVHSIRELIS